MRIIKNEAGTLDDEIEEAFRPTYSGNGHGADVQVRQAIEAHEAALAAYQAACAGTADDREVGRLGAIEKAARDQLIAIVPATLAGLADKIRCCLAFSLPE